MSLKNIVLIIIVIAFLKKLNKSNLTMSLTKKYLNLSSKNKSFNYIDIEKLTQYTTDQGKILPRRVTGLTTKKQRQITQQIKRARILSLVPFINK